MNKSTMTIVAALAAGAAVASTRTPYANDFTTRTSGATPSDRWMVSDYVPGALVRSVDSISTEGREPYNSATAYQDGWTMKAGACRTNVLFTVADDGGNQGVLANPTSTSVINNSTVAMQPFYNEFTDGVLKISADIRTPASSAFVSNTTAYASIIPIYKSALDVAASSLLTPVRLGMANASHNNSSTGDFYVRANVMSKNIDETGAGTYGYTETRNNLTAGNWYRYEAVIDIAAGTFTATFGDLGATHPSPDSVPSSVTDFRRYVDNAWTTTFKLNAAPSASTGGFAGLAIYVLGFKKAAASAAPMFDNIAVSWKAPDAEDFASVYENNFTTRRYRQIEPAGATTGAYALVPTTNTVQSSFYERGASTSVYAVKEDSCRRLVPDEAPYVGQDGWRRIAGTAPFTLTDPNNSGGYDWENATVLRATGSGKAGFVATPIGTTITSGKVRLYFDMMMGVITNTSTSAGREIMAACFLAGNGAHSKTYTSSTSIGSAVQGYAVCGGGTRYYLAANASATSTRINHYSGGTGLTDTKGPKSASDETLENKWIYAGRWGRYVLTLDLDARTYDYTAYQLGTTGRAMDYDHSSSSVIVSNTGRSLASDAPASVDSVVLFSTGQANYNGGNDVHSSSKRVGRFPLFDNVRVCRVNGDGTDGAELYSCNFEYSYRTSVRDAAVLADRTDRDGADRWIRRGNAYGTISAIDAGGGDGVAVLNDVSRIADENGNLQNRSMFAVQPFGSASRNCASVDFSADIRPPSFFSSETSKNTTSSGYAYVEVGGDGYAQGVYRPAKDNNWRYDEPRIGFGFTAISGKDACQQFTNIVFSVQTCTSSATTTTNSTAANIDTSHWYRFRVKAAPTNAGGTFTVKVYDQGTTKPAANAADGTLVETFSDLALPAFGGEGMTTFGLAASNFTGTRGGGIDDPNVALVDNLSVNFNPAAFVIVFK